MIVRGVAANAWNLFSVSSLDILGCNVPGVPGLPLRVLLDSCFVAVSDFH